MFQLLLCICNTISTPHTIAMVSALSTPPTGSPRVASPSAEEADGYLLLTIQHAVVKQVYDEEVMVLARGEMRCVFSLYL